MARQGYFFIPLMGWFGNHRSPVIPTRPIFVDTDNASRSQTCCFKTVTPPICSTSWAPVPKIRFYSGFVFAIQEREVGVALAGDLGD